jgi:biopolymer transport protein ExbD
MRTKLLIAVTLLATMISPAVTVAEPDTLAKKSVADNIVVENVQGTMNSKVGLNQEEVAKSQIDENLQKIEEQKKAAEAKAEADRVAAQEAVAVNTVVYNQKAIATAANGDNSDAIAYGRARNAEVFGDAQWSALFQLWSNESGWRDTALNSSSGACGIPQFINGCVVGDHVSQIDRGLVYIKARYGTPSNALAFWNARHWY